MTRLILGAVFGTVAALSMAGSAGAVVLTGDGWNVTNAAAGNAVIASLPGSGSATPDVTFNSNGLMYSSFGNTSCFPPTNSCSGNPSLDYTVDSWLKSIPGIATGITYANPGTEPGRILSDGSTTGTIFRFTGKADFTAGQSFTVNHDDGLTILIGGSFDSNGNLTGPGVVNLEALVDSTLNPTPTSPVTTSFTYPSSGAPLGAQNIEIIYGECCDAPAVLATTLADIPVTPGPVPEPTSLALFGSALFGFGLIRRRRNRVCKVLRQV